GPPGPADRVASDERPILALTRAPSPYIELSSRTRPLNRGDTHLRAWPLQARRKRQRALPHVSALIANASCYDFFGQHIGQPATLASAIPLGECGHRLAEVRGPLPSLPLPKRLDVG